MEEALEIEEGNDSTMQQEELEQSVACSTKRSQRRRQGSQGGQDRGCAQRRRSDETGSQNNRLESPMVERLGHAARSLGEAEDEASHLEAKILEARNSVEEAMEEVIDAVIIPSRHRIGRNNGGPVGRRLELGWPTQEERESLRRPQGIPGSVSVSWRHRLPSTLQPSQETERRTGASSSFSEEAPEENDQEPLPIEDQGQEEEGFLLNAMQPLPIQQEMEPSQAGKEAHPKEARPGRLVQIVAQVNDDIRHEEYRYGSLLGFKDRDNIACFQFGSTPFATSLEKVDELIGYLQEKFERPVLANIQCPVCGRFFQNQLEYLYH